MTLLLCDVNEFFDFVCLLDVKMNFTDLRAEPLWFEKEKINVNGETMIGLKSKIE